jgi:transcriptional/translational regulatory protein YebC/TACO1
MVDIELNVGERLSILTILPQEGSFLTLRLIRELKNKLGLSADELKEFDVKQEDGSIRWNAKGLETKKITFKEKEVELIANELKEIDKKKQLKDIHFSIYEKFVDDIEEK